MAMPCTVLIIDDNEDDILIMRLALMRARKNINAIWALTGERGLTKLLSENNLPDFIMLDIKLPGMSGIEVLQSLRGEVRLNKIPIIIVSHSGLESDMNASYEAGASSYLQKSADFDKFVKDIERILDRLSCSSTTELSAGM